MDEDAFLRTYRETLRPLYAWVARRAGDDRALCEDVVQEAWLRAADRWPREGPPRDPLAWLRAVCRNLLANHFRARRPGVVAPERLEEVLDRERPPTGEAAWVLVQGLARLPEGAARLLEAFHLDGKDVRTIAAEEGLGERAVEGRLRRARAKLREALAPGLAGTGDDR